MRPDVRRRIVCLAAVLAACLTAFGESAPWHRGPAGDFAISIVRVGRAAIEARTETPRGALQGDSYYYVDSRESVAVRVSGQLSSYVRLYALVRPLGATAWTVQQGAVRPAKKAVQGEWKAEVRFGEPSDAGGRFELLVIATAEPLPPVALPEGLRVASTLAESAVVHLERRKGRPYVGISRIGGKPVYDDQEIEVRDEAAVIVTVRDLPAESRAGVVVHPMGADTDRRWVMSDVSSGDRGEIKTYFGTGRRGEDFFRYTVSAFVAWKDEIPPPNVDIPPHEWQTYHSRFLAESHLVRVIRWEGELRIKAIGSLDVQSDLVLVIGPQEDVHGAVDRKLRPDEQIWIVCIPWRDKPWLAGHTSRLFPSGQWVINAARLWTEGGPTTFDLVAVVATGNPGPLQGDALRAWVYDQEHPRHSVRVRIEPP
ncbi:MAG TPA: hypothetical protein VF173_27445 [Thermoanaerobaculia bacterium]|nr:hypothetical protein [Thermoanaerobaculia bacterium]